MKLRDFMTKTFGLGEKGFTLMETMVAVGIGSIVTLGVSYMMENAARLKIQTDRSLEKTQLEFLFDSVLINPEDCSASLLEVDPGDPYADPPPTANRVYTTELTGVQTLPFTGLRKIDADGAITTVLDLQGPFPYNIPGSRIEIMSSLVRNLKVTKTVEIPDPNEIKVEFVARDTVPIPVAGTVDLMVGFRYKQLGADGGNTALVDKEITVVKTIPVKLAVERKADGDLTQNVFISGCRAGEDVAVADIEKYVCDNMAGGPQARSMVPSRWGNASYVECKDIKNVRSRLLEMDMCVEVGGQWDGGTDSCKNGSSIKSDFTVMPNVVMECPTLPGGYRLVVYAINPGDEALNPNTFEPSPYRPGDGILEKIECKPPCKEILSPVGTECEGVQRVYEP